MTYDEWYARFQPIHNTIDLTAAFDGRVFETFGPQLEVVRQKPANVVWTWVTGDEGEDLIVPGYHRVNRMGYFITQRPFTPDEEDLCIVIDDD